jgi:hypothetical protein
MRGTELRSSVEIYYNVFYSSIDQHTQPNRRQHSRHQTWLPTTVVSYVLREFNIKIWLKLFNIRQYNND